MAFFCWEMVWRACSVHWVETGGDGIGAGALAVETSGSAAFLLRAMKMLIATTAKVTIAAGDGLGSAIANGRRTLRGRRPMRGSADARTRCWQGTCWQVTPCIPIAGNLFVNKGPVSHTA